MKHEALIQKMTLEEQASLFSGKNFWQTRGIKRLSIPSLMMSDGPHGIRKQAHDGDHLGLNESVPATCFPTAATVANSWDVTLGEEMGTCLGEEASAQGVDILLGPGLNLKRSPLCGRNFEYFSEDPYLSGKLAASYVRGIQSKGVAACVKHFAANSQELRRMSNNSVVDERTFRELYTTAFEIAVKEGKAKSVMSAYNQVNGVYANENYHLLQEILVDEWGFDGIVISDWGASNSHVEGVKAGSHLEMPTTGRYGIQELAEAVQLGEISRELWHQRLDELLTMIFSIHQGVKSKGVKMFDVEEHHRMAQKVAEKSTVLLKNEEHILPLRAGTKLAVIGDFAEHPRYQGAGSSFVNATKLETPLEVWKREEGIDFLGYEPGFVRTGGENNNLLERAKLLAQSADVVLLYLGLDELSETEGMDRRHLGLAQNQIDLVKELAKVNANLVVVLSAGSVIEMPWISSVKGLLYAGLAGQAGASAMVRILRGRVCPSGRLSETYPIREEDTPTHRIWPGKQKSSEYREGPFVGYRYYDTVQVPVQFPFGYGLSYTRFVYEDIHYTEDGVSFTIKNIGDMPGEDVLQLYVGKKDSVLIRPKKELKGFTKVFLEVGESKQVTIPLDEMAFRYYHVEHGSWEVEAGTYTLMLARNVSDLIWCKDIEKIGSIVAPVDRREQLPSYVKGTITKVSKEEFEALLGYPVPERNWNTKELELQDPLCRMCQAKSVWARVAFRYLHRRLEKSLDSGVPDLNIYFIYNMPFRALAKMTGGRISMRMAEAILDFVNAKYRRGMKRMVMAAFDLD
jgi:beta-glucosidase